MKNFKKILITVMISCLLLIPTVSTVSAADMFNSDNISAVLQQFGLDLSNPESIQDIINQIREGGLSGILNLMGIDISEILDELQKYLISFELPTRAEETTTEEEETTTEEEESTTEEPTTSAPVYTPTYPSYNYTPPTYTPATTLPEETTTFQFIPPEQIYTEAFTTTVFQPVVEDDIGSIQNDTNPVKTAIGVILLLASGIGVIVVVLALKRNRI